MMATVVALVVLAGLAATAAGWWAARRAARRAYALGYDHGRADGDRLLGESPEEEPRPDRRSGARTARVSSARYIAPDDRWEDLPD